MVVTGKEMFDSNRQTFKLEKIAKTTIRITSNQNHKDYKQPNELEEKQIQQSAEHEGVCR